MPDGREDGAWAGDTIERRIAREMENLRELSQFRKLDLASGIDLSSNDYLGLA